MTRVIRSFMYNHWISNVYRCMIRVSYACRKINRQCLLMWKVNFHEKSCTSYKEIFSSLARPRDVIMLQHLVIQFTFYYLSSGYERKYPLLNLFSVRSFALFLFGVSTQSNQDYLVDVKYPKMVTLVTTSYQPLRHITRKWLHISKDLPSWT